MKKCIFLTALFLMFTLGNCAFAHGHINVNINTRPSYAHPPIHRVHPPRPPHRIPVYFGGFGGNYYGSYGPYHNMRYGMRPFYSYYNPGLINFGFNISI